MFLLNQEGPNCVGTLIYSLTEREVSYIPADSMDKYIGFIKVWKRTEFKLRINGFFLCYYNFSLVLLGLYHFTNCSDV